MAPDSLPILLSSGNTLSLLGEVEEGLQLPQAKAGLVSGLEDGLTRSAGGGELFSSAACCGERLRLAGGGFPWQMPMQRWLWPLCREIPHLAGCCDSLRKLP